MIVRPDHVAVPACLGLAPQGLEVELQQANFNRYPDSMGRLGLAFIADGFALVSSGTCAIAERL